MNEWSDKVVVITGASSGIGAALATALIHKGAKVALCARDINRLEELYKSYPQERIFLYQVDVSIKNECDFFVKKIIDKWGSINVLINNAGMSMRALFSDVDIKVIEQLMQINFFGTVYMTHVALPYIVKERGTIVGISSIAGYRGLPARSGYSASKFAMNGFLESIRTELLDKGVNVLTASPGFTNTNIRSTSLNAKGIAQKDSPLDENKLMSADDCASIIIKAIEKRKKEIIMTSQGKLTVWINKLLPRWADRLVFNHFAKESNSPLQ